jgi:hypothetical protein
MIEKPQIVKVQVAAEFVVADGEHLAPGTFGPVEMTAREWAEFDLQAAIEAGIVAQIRETARNGAPEEPNNLPDSQRLGASKRPSRDASSPPPR